MFTNDGYALLIGVDDYSAFDASASQAKGTSDLPGSRNDVKTFWRLCLSIGIRPENIRVLASPAIAPSELEGSKPENVGTATRDEILDKAAWLASMLAQASKPTALLTYSGHGDWIAGQGLVLCPSDVAQAPEGKLAHAVSFQDLNDRLAAHAENLTVVLDTCHSGMAPGASAGNGKGTTLTGRPISTLPGLQPKGHARELVELSGRVLAAARRDQVAYQSKFGGEYHGVFSWALTTALGQWRATQEAGNVRFDVSYGTLVETAGRLLSSLFFAQTPELHGPPGIESLAVLRQGLGGEPGETRPTPDGLVAREQLDSGWMDYIIYSILDTNGSQVGQVLVTATAGAGYLANYEYWYMTSNISNSSGVTLSGGTSQSWSNPPSGLGTLSFKMVRTPSWALASMRGTMLVYSNSLTGEYDAMNWQMTNSSGTWTGYITWWHNSTGNLLGPSTSRTLSPTATSGRVYCYTSTPV